MPRAPAVTDEFLARAVHGAESRRRRSERERAIDVEQDKFAYRVIAEQCQSSVPSLTTPPERRAGLSRPVACIQRQRLVRGG
jgi:hypothetical protein